VDAVGNVICAAYDAIHRSTAVTYPSGSYASVTPARHFVYDSATVDGTVMGNTKGKLAEAYTCSSCPSSKITDLGFSYTARGEISDEYQTSPNSAGWYHASLTYWPNGVLHQLSGLPTVPTLTYGVDSEGRTNTISASTGQNPLTGTTYNTASLPTAVTLGSGDSDGFSYDPNTNRMTQYQFNISAQSFVGKLSWNTNGTLASQQSIDPFNNADNQTCNYTHDDLIRIASVNCGASVWQQNFSYDVFGNLAKTVPTGGTGMSFQPTYSSTTNQIISLPGCTPTYDANGNSLNNCSHTYTWDSDGHHATVDGIGLSYDALGRMIELAYPSEVFYLPGGSQVLFKGQVAHEGIFRLPGGVQAFYDSTQGGLFLYAHADHLGSLRLTSTPTQSFSTSLAYAPFGEEYAPSNSNAQGNAAFTGWGSGFGFDEFDFPAREYMNQGRWVSPDPAGLAAVDPATPQSWNRYAYVGNNPLATTDPLGLFGKGDCPWWDPQCDADPDPVPVGPCDVSTGLCGGFGGRGGGGGGGARPPASTPIPEAPEDVGSPIDDPGFGTGPIWTEQIPIGAGPINPWLIIENWSTTVNGTVIGDFPNEQLCLGYPAGGCALVFWNAEKRIWDQKPTATTVDQRVQDFVHALTPQPELLSPNACAWVTVGTAWAGAVGLFSPEPVSKFLGWGTAAVGTAAIVVGCI